MKTTTLSLFLSLLLLGCSAALAQNVEGGSLGLSTRLENTHVHVGEPTVHALIGVEAARGGGSQDLPINLALVIDRSGSMQGQKIADARAAALGMIDRLRKGDRVSIVTYSDDVRVDVSSTVVNRRSRGPIKDVVRRISAGGSTFLSGGLERGHQQVRNHLDREHVHRVLLISDGLANRGITAVPALNRIARMASQDGIVTTTLGLGADYNEDLMTSVADHGGGNYYFVEDSSQLANVLNGELSQMMATVAREVTLEIGLPAGVRMEEVFGYAWEPRDGQAVIRLGDVFSGQTRAVLCKLRVPANTGHLRLGNVTLNYLDPQTGVMMGAQRGDLNVSVTTSAGLVARNIDQEVAARIAEIELATSMQEAADLVQAGRYDDARTTLEHAQRAAQRKSTSLGSQGKGLRESARQADELLDALASPPASAAEQKGLVKRSKSKAYQIRKK